MLSPVGLNAKYCIYLKAMHASLCMSLHASSPAHVFLCKSNPPPGSAAAMSGQRGLHAAAQRVEGLLQALGAGFPARVGLEKEGPPPVQDAAQVFHGFL